MPRKNIIYFVVVIIGVLLIADIILTRRNNKIIRKNKALQNEISGIRFYYDQIGKVFIHSLDIGLRGYAIVQEKELSAPMEAAVAWQDSIVSRVEQPLSRLNYDLTEFKIFKDSLDAYAKYCFRLRDLIDKGEHDTFVQIFKTDKGAQLWWQYILCERSISSFMKKLNDEAQKEYEAAMSRNHLIQIILFVICFPTLLYTAFHTTKNFHLYELLKTAVEEKNKILREQNITLEQQVAHRTQELATQNEEMVSQSEELAAQRDALSMQNKKLQEATKIIEVQNEEIQSKNKILEKEVESRTHDLQTTNEELIKHNNQLEQFAFIAAHNLRAPLARILGLVNVMQIVKREEDKNMMMEKLIISTQDLDHVISDLNIILDIKKHKSNITEVDLPATLTRVLASLEREIKDTSAKVISSFDKEAVKIKAVPPYVESIVYNLVSNAIKYRNPDKQPVIYIEAIMDDEYVRLSVKDNGLGIDLSKYRANLFNLYKRFHLHVEGKGLGLYLTRTQIQALGGKIEVVSELEAGTTFTVSFKR